MEVINYQTKVIMGEDSLGYLENYREQRIFIVADPFIAQSELINLVTDRFHSSNILHIFNDVVPDPPVENVVSGMSEFIEFQGSMILAVGGGSAIDLGKAIKYFSKKVKFGPKPICVVLPTTSGAGSEVTSFAVITDQQKGIKYPLISDEISPDIAILSEILVAGVPPTVVADSGIDVLTHALEAYVSTNATVFSDALAEKSLKLVFKYLVRSYENGKEDLEAKANMHYASCMAGLAFNQASLGLNHGIAHSAGSKYHLPHGRINSLLLPAVIAFNSELDYQEKNTCWARSRYTELAKNLGLVGNSETESVKLLIKEIDNLQKKIKLPQTLLAAGVSSETIEESLEEIATGTLKDSCTKTNPRVATVADIMDIVRGISGI